jgi:hypothetical protein
VKFSRPLQFLAGLFVALTIATLLDVTSTSKNYSESFPAVVCPPTLPGLASQVSFSSRKTQFQRLQDRSTKTLPVKVLRLPVIKDSLVINGNGSTPVVWQSRTGSWAGGTLCSGPAASKWFVGASADLTSRGRLIIVNSGLSSAVVDIQAYTENGKQPLKTISIAAKNFANLSVVTFAPGDKTLALHVIARSGRINSFVIDEQVKGLKTLGGDIVNPIEFAAKEFVIPAIPNQLARNSRTPASAHTLRILTPGEIDANVTVEVVSADGVFIPVGFNSRSISAGIVTEFSLAPNISATAFALRVKSSEPIVVSVQSSVVVSGRSDFAWITPAPALTPLVMAITGLSPQVVFAGEKIAVALEVTLINGDVIRRNITGTDIATWRAPANARSFSITQSSNSTYAGALVSSVNGYGYFPIQPGSVLTKIEKPASNIRVLNP